MNDRVQMAMTRGLIAYNDGHTEGPQHIMLADVHGNFVKQLTHGDSIDFFPAWSPDGKTIAFTSDRDSTPRFWGIDLAGQGWERIDQEQMGEYKMAVAIGISQIWIMDADGSNRKRLTTEGANAHPMWSPDGKRIAFSSNRTGKMEIWAMDADGGNQTQLTDTPSINASRRLAGLVTIELIVHGLGDTNEEGITNLFPSWSPDGKRIAFVSTRGGTYAIWSMDSDGGNFMQLTQPLGDRYPFANIPTWSPVSNKIVFWSGKDLGPGSIWTMDPEGSNRKKLTERRESYTHDEPAWSADGSKVLFAVYHPSDKEAGIWIVDADGSNQRPFITIYRPSRIRASWQPIVPED